MKIKYLKEGDIINLKDNYWKVLKITHIHLGRGRANIEFILKNIIDNSTIKKNFNSDDEIKTVEVNERDLKFLYLKQNIFYFLDEENKKFEIDKKSLGKKANFIKKDLKIKGLFVENKLIGIEIPVKAIYRVIFAPPGLKGDSEKTNNKFVTIETGAQILTPLFIKEGDLLLINTEKGEYVERAK